MARIYRYYANAQFPKDFNEETGERTYFLAGEEIPVDRFASGQALRAALHRNAITAVAVEDGTVAAGARGIGMVATKAEIERHEAARAAESAAVADEPAPAPEAAPPVADEKPAKSKSGG